MGKHFVTGKFPFHATARRLPDDVYGQALDCFVISTLDVVVIRFTGEIFLGRRAWEPAQGLFWIVGGARDRGENFEQTASRHLKHELGIEAEPMRFRELGCYSYAWARRRQTPQDHGSHTDSHVFTVELTDAEVAAIKPNAEYSETMWIRPEEVVNRAHEFHPAIVQICRDFLATMFKSSR